MIRCRLLCAIVVLGGVVLLIAGSPTWVTRAPALLAAISTGDCDGNGTPDDADLPRFELDLPLRLGAGDDPYAVAVGDLTGDGLPDIATANSASGDVSVLVNLGARAFAPAATYAVGARPIDLEAGDVDGDGDLDLAVAAQGTGHIVLLVNDGAGTFTPGQALSVPTSPARLRLADMDGDSRLDVVAQGGDVVAVLRNQDQLGFAAAVTVATGPDAGLAVGDLDGDGDPDLVLGQAEPKRLRVLRNDRNLVFTAADVALVDAPDTGLIDPVALADVDDDLDLDVIVAFADTAVWLRNDRTGALGEPRLLSDSSGRVALGDIDRNGTSDLIGVIRDDEVFVSPDASTGPHPAVQRVAAGTDLFTPAVGDITGDGYPDVVLSGGSDDSIWVIFGSDHGLRAPDAVRVGTRLAAALPDDFDDDGDLDLAVTNGPQGRVYLLRNGGHGDLTEAASIPVPANPGQGTTTDLDNDGDRDLALALGDGTVFLLRNQGAYTFVPGPRIAQMNAAGVIVSADIDGDGDDDLAVPRGSEVTVLRQEAGGTYAHAGSYAVAVSARGLAHSDFDADGDTDLLAGSESKITALLNDGTGVFTPKFLAPIAVNSLAVGDLDADADDDIVVGAPRYKGVAVIRNHGGGQIGAPEPVEDSIGTLGPALADLNGDGAIDIAGNLTGESTLTVAVNRGNGRLQPTRHFEFRDDNSWILSADFDGDAKSELLWVDFGTNVVLIAHSTVSGSPSADCDGNGVLDVCEVAGRDCDADGTLDLCELDADEDTMPDACDMCPGVDDRADGDGDGIPDCRDICLDDGGKSTPGVCGCGIADSDSDADGVLDCRDRCPLQPDAAQTDADGDERGDACEECPFDPNRGRASVCGCGVPDTDADADSWPDCIDLCPDDALRSVPGMCGCGRPEASLGDVDLDGVRDCTDNCPDRPNPEQGDGDGDGLGDACDAAEGPHCPGDCDGSGTTTADELAAIVPLLFDVPAIVTCRPVDANDDARVTAAEVVWAMRLRTGCDGNPPPTPALEPVESPVRSDRHFGAYGDPAVCCSAGGACVVAWVDTASTVLAQRLDADGRPRGEPIVVTAGSGQQPRQPAVACDEDAAFFATWQGPGATAEAGTDVYGRRFDAAGWPGGAAVRVNAAIRYDQGEPAMAADGHGRVAVAWSSRERDGEYIASVALLRIYPPDGSPTVPQPVQDLSVGPSESPAVDMAPDGTVVAAWATYIAGRRTVMARRFDSHGVPFGAPVTVSGEHGSRPERPAVAAGPQGDFTVAWQDKEAANGRAILLGRHFDARSEPTSTEVTLGTLATTPQDRLALARPTDGRGLAVWQTRGPDVWGRWLAPDGTPGNDPFPVNSVRLGEQGKPAVAFDGRGIAVVVWAGHGPGDRSGIFVKRYDSTGAPLPAPTPLPTVPEPTATVPLPTD